MTTINLEKSLIRENKKLAIPKELLLINEYDKFSAFAENDVLQRIGLNQTLKEGKNIKNRINRNSEQTKAFNQERVFHISQIEGICKKYRLRFLPIHRYRGVIDSELPNKISNFEIAYNLKCTKYNTRIVAPMRSFELEKKPKDPLMFYEINEEYFYLIHKWGNNLSSTRAILPILENGLFLWLSIPSICSLLFFINFNVGITITTLSFALISMVETISYASEGKFISFINKNDWQSWYK